RYKEETDINFQFLADYFDSGKNDTLTKKGWEVKFGDLVLDDVRFIYRKEKSVEPPSRNINYDDIVLTTTSGIIRGFHMQGDTAMAEVIQLSTREQSGFVLSSLSANAAVSSKQLLCNDLRLKTPRSFVKRRLEFLYADWE